jgi:hypothetical protein
MEERMNWKLFVAGSMVALGLIGCGTSASENANAVARVQGLPTYYPIMLTDNLQYIGDYYGMRAEIQANRAATQTSSSSYVEAAFFFCPNQWVDASCEYKQLIWQGNVPNFKTLRYETSAPKQTYLYASRGYYNIMNAVRITGITITERVIKYPIINDALPSPYVAINNFSETQIAKLKAPVGNAIIDVSNVIKFGSNPVTMEFRICRFTDEGVKTGCRRHFVDTAPAPGNTPYTPTLKAARISCKMPDTFDDKTQLVVYAIDNTTTTDHYIEASVTQVTERLPSSESQNSCYAGTSGDVPSFLRGY